MSNAQEIYRAHTEGLRQYVHLLLAASAAAIAFAVNQTRDAQLELSHLPLGVAVALWGASFYLGCRHLQSVNSGLAANSLLLQSPGDSPDREGLRQAVVENSNRSSKTANWAFRLLVAGAVCFVAWHMLQMYLRSL